MEMFIIYSLLGDTPRAARRPEKKMETKDSQTMCLGVVKHLSGDQPGEAKPEGMLRELAVENAWLQEENRLMKEELNELYASYDQLSAAFGEMRGFIREAASVPGRYWREGEEA